MEHHEWIIINGSIIWLGSLCFELKLIWGAHTDHIRRPPTPGFKPRFSRLRAQHSTTELFRYAISCLIEVRKEAGISLIAYWIAVWCYRVDSYIPLLEVTSSSPLSSGEGGDNACFLNEAVRARNRCRRLFSWDSITGLMPDLAKKGVDYTLVLSYQRKTRYCETLWEYVRRWEGFQKSV